LEKVFVFSVGAAAIVALFALQTFVVWASWNDVIVYVFGLKAITMLQAFEMTCITHALIPYSKTSVTK